MVTVFTKRQDLSDKDRWKAEKGKDKTRMKQIWIKGVKIDKTKRMREKLELT